GYLIVFDRFAAFKIGGGRSQPEMHGYFRPSLNRYSNKLGVTRRSCTGTGKKVAVRRKSKRVYERFLTLNLPV
ncbi:hypothetical protein, partial [Stutzerimonas kunmingensis]|uniref:hypothetical protein n=1 Tax=Stutzerimonas kunmingensis TaxID=1211807 RepID=UPI0037D51585